MRAAGELRVAQGPYEQVAVGDRAVDAGPLQGARPACARPRRGWARGRRPWRASGRSGRRSVSPSAKPVSSADAVRDGRGGAGCPVCGVPVRAPGPRRTAGPRPRGRARAGGSRSRALRPRRRAVCRATRSSPNTASVTGCSTWRRVFISRKCGACRRRRGTRRCPRPRSRRRGRRVRPARAARRRSSSARPGAGASSMTFWWRRWREQSRVPSAHTVPCASARICTSTCRPPSTYGSTKTSPSPKALAASARAAVQLGVQVGEFADDAHAAPAAARRGLDQHRQVGLGDRSTGRAAGRRRRHQLLGAGLGRHRLDRLGRRADPDQARRRARRGRSPAFSERKP